MECCNVPVNAVLLTGDKAHFHLPGCINKKNFRYWVENNPSQLHERPLHSEQGTVWYTVAKFGVWYLYFFEEGDYLVTVTSDWYVKIIHQTFLEPKLRDLWSPYVCLQKDGGTVYIMRRSMYALREMLPRHLISLCTVNGWPACS